VTAAATHTTLREVADRLIGYPWQAWFYGDSIGFEGLVAASDLLGEERYAAFAHGFLRGWATRDRPHRPDDNTAPGHLACEIALRTGDGELRAALIRLALHLAARRRIGGVTITFEDAGRSLREPYGGVPLPEGERGLLPSPGAGIYLDCLHFDPPFYASLGRLTGDRQWRRRAVEEARGYVRLLADPASGLYHHFWLERTGRAYGLGWGRGQGWALLGLLDTLALLDATEPGGDELVGAASGLAEAMLGCQLADGSWSAVVQLPGSGPEASTAAFMAVAFQRGVSLGVLPADPFEVAAHRAWRATLARLDDGGHLADVSAAVYSSTALEHYAHVPLGFDVPWGLGPVLVAALEHRRAAARRTAR
jgi:unsaturated rhamnogalacturonyl hydrolase